MIWLNWLQARMAKLLSLFHLPQQQLEPLLAGRKRIRCKNRETKILLPQVEAEALHKSKEARIPLIMANPKTVNQLLKLQANCREPTNKRNKPQM